MIQAGWWTEDYDAKDKKTDVCTAFCGRHDDAGDSSYDEDRRFSCDIVSDSLIPLFTLCEYCAPDRECRGLACGYEEADTAEKRLRADSVCRPDFSALCAVLFLRFSQDVRLDGGQNFTGCSVGPVLAVRRRHSASERLPSADGYFRTDGSALPSAAAFMLVDSGCKSAPFL